MEKRVAEQKEKHVEKREGHDRNLPRYEFFKEDILKKLQEKLNISLARGGGYFEMYGKRTGVIELYTDIAKNAESMINQWKQRFGKIYKRNVTFQPQQHPIRLSQFYLHRQWMFLKPVLCRLFLGV